jgi:hypothetical protein
MLSFKEFFYESTSPLRRLYHYTSLDNAASIVSNDKFVLLTAKADANDNYEYYFSTSTTPNAQYGKSMGNMLGTKYIDSKIHVIFELDASKLSDKYKIRPYHWWGEGQDDEMEDQIISKTREILNARKYIISVNIFIPKKIGVAYTLSGIMEEINIIERSGVDYRIYDNIEAFSMLARKYARKMSSDEIYKLISDNDNGKWNRAKEFINIVNWLLNATPDNNRFIYSEHGFYKKMEEEFFRFNNDKRPDVKNAVNKLEEYLNSNSNNFYNIWLKSAKKAHHMEAGKVPKYYPDEFNSFTY